MPVVSVKNIKKDFGFSRGVFDISFDIRKGECFGFLGPNGAGKTTTIRLIMGFSKPHEGKICVKGMDSWENSSVIQNFIGYLPGEVSLPDGLSGLEFLNMIVELRGIKDLSQMNRLIKLFNLGGDMETKKMSLGVKRKLAVVAAFMHDPEILILDEPTSGLDPMMQDEFIKFINGEKERGKTILLSSHIFSEIDAACDRIAIIKEGKIVSEFIADDLRNKMDKTYQMEFAAQEDYDDFADKDFKFILKDREKRKVKILVGNEEINKLTGLLSGYKLRSFSEVVFSLEDYFMQFYRK